MLSAYCSPSRVIYSFRHSQPSLSARCRCVCVCVCSLSFSLSLYFMHLCSTYPADPERGSSDTLLSALQRSLGRYLPFTQVALTEVWDKTCLCPSSLVHSPHLSRLSRVYLAWVYATQPLSVACHSIQHCVPPLPASFGKSLNSFLWLRVHLSNCTNCIGTAEPFRYHTHTHCHVRRAG